MELQRLSLFAALGQPIGAKAAQQEAQPTGPPVFGGPPPGAAGLQKEVTANELKPQAKILDLLERILLADANQPTDARSQKSGLDQADRDLAVSIGDFRADARVPDYSQILVALGVPVPASFDATSLEEFKAAVADALVSDTLPAAVADVVNAAFGARAGNVASVFGARSEKPTHPALIDTPADETKAVIEKPSTETDRAIKAKDDQGQKAEFKTLELHSPLVRDPYGARPTHAARPTKDKQDYDILIGEPTRKPVPSIVPSRSDAKPKDEATKTEQFGSRPIDVARPIVITGERQAYSDRALDKGALAALRPSSVDVTLGRPEKIQDDVFAFDRRWNTLLQKAPLTAKIEPAPIASDIEVPVEPKIAVAKPLASAPIDWPEGARAVVTATASKPASDTKLATKAPELIISQATTGDARSPDSGVLDVNEVVLKEEATVTKTKGKTSHDPLIDIDIEPTVKTDPPSVALEAVTPKEVRTLEVPAKIEPAQTDTIKEKVVEQVQEIAALRGNGRVTIKLQPDELGTITLAVKSLGDTVEAKVTASNENVRHALHSQRADLVQGIESRGLSLGSFTVGTETHQGQDEHGQRQPQDMRQDFARAHNVWHARNDQTTQDEAPRYSRYKLVGVDTLA